VEVPTTDFDFEEANAKFNKEDLAKETVSPLATPGNDLNGSATATPAVEEKTQEEVVIPKAENVYDKKTSFFDNISSELKDKQAAAGGNTRGQEFRSEERRKNMETFGQGSVDNGYRRGYGRGRGRGRGYQGQSRGRGGFDGGRGGYTPRPRGGGQQAES
jgi:protein LSM14